MKFTILNKLSEINHAHAQFESFVKKHEIPGIVHQKISIVLDEVLANIITHAYPDQNEHDIEIHFELLYNALSLQFFDDGQNFNPLTYPIVTYSEMPLESRPTGGLGIHLLKTFTDEVVYERQGEKNMLRIIKHMSTA